MIAEKSEELPPLIDRLRSLEENWLIEPEKVKSECNQLHLSQQTAQTLLQEDRNSGC